MKSIDFVGMRKWFFTLPILIILTGLVFGFINGLNLDIDFKGGTVMTVNMKSNDFDINEVKKLVVENTGEENSTVLTVGLNKDQVSIRAPKNLSPDEIDNLFDNIKSKYALADNDLTSAESIEPLAGKELTNRGLIAILISSSFTLLYIAFVFRKMGGFVAGLTAIIGLLHDVLILLSVYLIFHIPINISFIAAVLTVLGYSVNDTIVVYDRIRENEELLKKVPVNELVNKSITQTLGRTVNTTLTTIITILVLYIFGAMYNIDSLTQFTLPLLIGMIGGTYSSIFICSPLYVMISEYSVKKEKLARA